MGSAPSKPLSTPAVEEKRSSQSGVEQATARLQVLDLRGLGGAASTDGTLSQGNVQEWEQKAGKVHELLYLECTSVLLLIFVNALRIPSSRSRAQSTRTRTSRPRS